MMRQREAVNAEAARKLLQYIQSLGLSVAKFSKRAGVKGSSLRYFLNNDSSSPSARRHSRGPYATTLAPILELDIPDDLRQALLNPIYFEERIAIPSMPR